MLFAMVIAFWGVLCWCLSGGGACGVRLEHGRSGVDMGEVGG